MQYHHVHQVSCQLSSCNSGFGNCDGNPSNGCETPLNTLTDCITCGTVCSLNNAISSCSSGSCQLSSCNSGFGNCDGNPSNGCETPLNSLTHCGVCGTTCGYTNAITDCSSGSCVFQSCSSPFLDCNSNLGLDGCETNGNTDGNHCGNCGTVCSGGKQCTSGVCATVVCPGGSADCDTNGSCETDINNDVNNCGGCGHVCSSNHGTASCSAGICSIICNSGFGNCNADITDGCETDLHTLSNCGVCSSICSLNNAISTCSSGTCQLSSCNSGFGNCDANPSNGCESPLNTNSHCGVCGTTCSLNNAISSCSSGTCQLTSCNSGFGNCDGNPSNGCETPLNTLTDCATCGTVCSLNNAISSCSSGSCQLSSCNSGFGNCDGNPSNGCDTPLNTLTDCITCGTACSLNNAVSSCSSGTCQLSSCNSGFGNCDANPSNGCETTLNSNSHCGVCGTVCSLNNAISSCSSGTCQLSSCNSGFGNCDGNPSNGCETPLNSLTHCGVCGTTCGYTNAITDCSSGSCVFQSCSSPFLDCNSNLGLDGCETNGNTDDNHCGNCGTVCSGGKQCTSGVCTTVVCPGGSADCDTNGSCETDINNDVNNCGGCGHVCSSNHGTASCSAGICSIICNSGFDNCNADITDGCETDLHTLSNCGVCSSICSLNNAISTCSSGTCQISTCNGGWGNCDSNPSNGCESPLNTLSNCGVCGTTCSLNNAVSSCSSGTCQLTSCNGGFGNCDANSSNGCETSLNTLTDCITCGTACSLNNAISSCSSGSCQLSSCNSGFGNCDGNPSNGCETTLNTLPNCGVCGTACSLNNAVSSCSSGTCQLSSCNGGWNNCNSIDSDGCEVNLSDSMSNCGACNNPCTLPNANSICSGGICLVSSCNTGFGDCTIGAGCETSLTTTSDCGTCGNACSLPNATPACISSTCQISSCNSGFGDCDLNAANGCEVSLSTTINHCGSCATNCNTQVLNASPTCSAGVCGYTTCNTGFLDCDGDPTNGCETVRSISNCASCGNSCSVSNGQPSCVSGSCTVLSCNAPFSDCDGLYSTGCEVNRNTDTSNCGVCGIVCSLSQSGSTCLNGICRITTCNNGFGDCDKVASNGCEVNLLTNQNNCGSCGRICPINTVCNNGACLCISGFADCDSNFINGCETDIITNVNNCGSCDNQCPTTNTNPTCNSGVCEFACVAPFFDCDKQMPTGCEINTSNDANNCGSCSNICALPNANPFCLAGNCSIASCLPNFGDCDGLASSGCEIDFSRNQTNCGSCGTVCPDNTVCSSGRCVCLPNFANCDGISSNGCEENLLTSSLNCGFCKNTCPQNRGCSLGTCSCQPNFSDCDGDSANGCETNTNSDLSHCGICERTCTETTSGTISCTNGACLTSLCTTARANCDLNSSNGCEVTLNSVDNCSGCGDRCVFANARSTCDNSQCTMTCNDGYSDADDIRENGCEQSTINIINIAPPDTTPPPSDVPPPPPPPTDIIPPPPPPPPPADTQLNSTLNPPPPPPANENIPPPPPPGSGIPVSENTVVQSQTISLSAPTETTTASSPSNTAPVIPITLPTSTNSQNSQPTGTIQIPVNVIAGTDQVTLVIATTDVTIPSNSGTGTSSSFDFDTTGISSSVVTIILYDNFGNEVHELDAPITICLSANDISSNAADMCLAYEKIVSGKSSWVCESALSVDDSLLFCGDTSHCNFFIYLF